jgi:hypothetical protein
MTRHCRFWLLGLTTVCLAAWGYDRVVWMDWVGATNLEVGFLVTETPSGQPIEGAEFAVSKDSNYRAEREMQFQLVTDSNGSTQRRCHCLAFGGSSGLFISNTYVVDLPWWNFQVSAPGYQTSEQMSLHAPEYERQIQRIGRGVEKLVVHVSLCKVRAEQGVAANRPRE